MKIPSGIIAIATLAVLTVCNHHTRAEQLHRRSPRHQRRRRQPAAQQHHRRHPNGLLGRGQPHAPPTTALTGPSPARTTSHGRLMRATSTQTPAPRPRPSRTSATTPSTRSACRARYYRGEHEGKSWGGPWATATITVAGEPADTPTPEPSPEPTPAPGTIDTLAATDDAAGQLVLTWDPPAAPNAAPTDYHVNWAKSSEDYPADTAEAGNAHPTTTTHTLAGLEYDTDYNVRVRARYTDGENAASPWNGPVDGNHHPGQAAAAHGHQHDGRRRQSGKSSLSVLVGPLE